MQPSFQKQKYCYSSCCGKYRYPLLGIFIICASQTPTWTLSVWGSLFGHWRRRVESMNLSLPWSCHTGLHCIADTWWNMPTGGLVHPQPVWPANIHNTKGSRAKSQITPSTPPHPSPGRML